VRFIVGSVSLLACGRLAGLEDKFEQGLAVVVCLLANFPKRG